MKFIPPVGFLLWHVKIALPLKGYCSNNMNGTIITCMALWTLYVILAPPCGKLQYDNCIYTLKQGRNFTTLWEVMYVLIHLMVYVTVNNGRIFPNIILMTHISKRQLLSWMLAKRLKHYHIHYTKLYSILYYTTALLSYYST